MLICNIMLMGHVWTKRLFATTVVIIFTVNSSCAFDLGVYEIPIAIASINITYNLGSLSVGAQHSTALIGVYGANSRVETEKGKVVHVQDDSGERHGCSKITNVPNYAWIALIQRGTCQFKHKVYNAAIVHNATAVIVYNSLEEESLLHMVLSDEVHDVVSVFIRKENGDAIAGLVDVGIDVEMTISLKSISTHTLGVVNSQNGTLDGTGFERPSPLLHITLTIVGLLLVGLLFLLICAVRRAHFGHQKHSSHVIMYERNSGPSQQGLLSVESTCSTST